MDDRWKQIKKYLEETNPLQVQYGPSSIDALQLALTSTLDELSHREDQQAAHLSRIMDAANKAMDRAHEVVLAAEETFGEEPFPELLDDGRIIGVQQTKLFSVKCGSPVCGCVFSAWPRPVQYVCPKCGHIMRIKDADKHLQEAHSRELEAEFHEHIGHDERANKCCGKGNPVKHEFQVRDHEKCPRCGADDVTVTWDSPSWFCDKCKGKSAADLDKECDQSELCECMKKLQDQGLAICDFEKKWSMLLVPAECAKWPRHHQIKYCPICGRVL